MQKIRFHLSLTADEFLRYYEGAAQAILVRADDGRKVQLPAGRFRRFVTQEGIQGRFEITLDSRNKLMEINRVS